MSQLLEEFTSTREGSSDLSLGEMVGDDSLTTTMINSIAVDHEIVGTNSRLNNEYQMSDPNLKWIRDIILHSKTNSGHKIEIPKRLRNSTEKVVETVTKFKKNLTYLVDENKFGNKRNRYVIPRSEVELTIKELHCKETAGHLGTDNMIEKIKSRFFWVNLSRDVKKFIRGCFDCQKVKPPKVYCKPKLVPLAPSRTLQLITMDMAGPLPLTKGGHKYILAICDHFTKHIKVFPMKTMAAIEVSERCLDYCLTFGIPESVLTDQGSNFTTQVIESLWERLDVLTLCTTAYHPQTDGITERFNRTIKTMLTQFVHDQKQDDWDTK